MRACVLGDGSGRARGRLGGGRRVHGALVRGAGVLGELRLEVSDFTLLRRLRASLGGVFGCNQLSGLGSFPAKRFTPCLGNRALPLAVRYSCAQPSNGGGKERRLAPPLLLGNGNLPKRGGFGLVESRGRTAHRGVPSP